MTPNQLVGVTHVTRRHCRCRASHSCRWEGNDSGSLAIGRKNSTCIDTTTKAYWYNMKSLSSIFSWSFRLIHRSTHIIRAILITSTYRTCSSFIRAAHGPHGPERPKGDGALEYCTSLPAWTLSGVTVVSTAVGFLAGSKSKYFVFECFWMVSSVSSIPALRFPCWKSFFPQPQPIDPSSCLIFLSSLPLRWLNSAWQTRGGARVQQKSL